MEKKTNTNMIHVTYLDCKQCRERKCEHTEQ